MSDFVQSKYCYPGTEVLINHAGIRNEEQLKFFEGLQTGNRLAELVEKPTSGKFDLNHLKKIHHHIFQDVYPFAGQLRTEDISKNTFRFAPMRFFESSAAELFQGLAKEKQLKGLPMEEFANRAAHYMAEINILHPFREGNGRTQREFVRQLAANAGYQLDWSKADKSIVLQASIRSAVDTKELSNVILSCMDKKPETARETLLLKDLLKQVEGMPSAIHNRYLPDHKDLNRGVSKYRVRNVKGQSVLEFQLKGDTELRSLRMEKVPHLNAEMKNKWIEQAAQNVKSISLGKGLER